MNLKEWQKMLGKKKFPSLHGVYDAIDMDGRIVGRTVYIKGRKVMTIAPIWPEEEITIDDEKK
jgi:hypothetical protein